MDRVDRKNSKDAAFDVVLRGYDKRQVDERLRMLVAELSAAQDAVAVAAQRVTTLEDELNRVRSGGDPQSPPLDVHQLQPNPPDSNFGARVEKILMLAGEEAREVRSQAEQEATAVRMAVSQEADELFKTAARDADEVCKAARVEAAQLVAQARAEANRLVTTAAENAQQRERASAHELQQLSRLQDEINADLYRAKEVLESLFGATKPSTRAIPATTARAAGSGATAAVTTAPVATVAGGARRPPDGGPDRYQARTV